MRFFFFFHTFISTGATEFVVAMPISGGQRSKRPANGELSNDRHINTVALTVVQEPRARFSGAPAARWVTRNYHARFVSSGQGVEV